MEAARRHHSAPRADEPLPFPRKPLAVLILALALAGAWLTYQLAGSGRYTAREDVEARLRALPGVEGLEVRGHEDVTYELDGFTLAVEGRGTLSLGPLDRDSFDAARSLAIEAIGGYEPIVVQQGFLGVTHADTGEPMRSTGWGGGIDVGTEGAFARLFPVPLHSVPDILLHYEEVRATLSSWPVQPAYATLHGEDGTATYYALRNPALEDPWIHPNELSGGD